MQQQQHKKKIKNEKSAKRERLRLFIQTQTPNQKNGTCSKCFVSNRMTVAEPKVIRSVFHANLSNHVTANSKSNSFM